MRRSVFFPTMGQLINDVLSRILDEIEDQNDIGEEESRQLNALCKILHGLDSLFAGPDEVRTLLLHRLLI